MLDFTFVALSLLLWLALIESIVQYFSNTYLLQCCKNTEYFLIFTVVEIMETFLKFLKSIKVINTLVHF